MFVQTRFLGIQRSAFSVQRSLLLRRFRVFFGGRFQVFFGGWLLLTLFEDPLLKRLECGLQ